MIQMIYGSVRLYLTSKIADDQRGFYYYFHLFTQCFSLGAAVVLSLGVILEKRNFLLPWMGLAIITPGVFFISLSFDLLFFNFSAASWLLINEGVPAIIMLYMIYTVFSLYQEMAPKNAEIDAESGVAVADTLYGTANVFTITENSSSIPSDDPPRYDSLVMVHKQHVTS